LRGGGVMNLIDIAEDYKLAGLNPLPLYKDKAPKLAPGHPYLYEEVPDHLIERLFERAEKIGIACGSVSDKFYCIDFDKHGGQDIKTIFEQYIQNPIVYELLRTKRISAYVTPSQGYHLYYKGSIEQGGQTFAKWDAKEVMIEMRGNGQYAAVYPSEGYAHLHGCEITEVDRLELSEEQELHNLARSFTLFFSQKDQSTNEKSDRKWPEKWDTNNPRGKFNEENISRISDWLGALNWEYEYTRSDGVEYWRRAGKDKGISGTVGANRGMFYCFTSSDANFEANTAYSPFDLFTIVEHKGDWKKALEAITPKATIAERDVIPDPESFPLDIFPKGIQDLIHELKEGADYYEDFVSVSIMTAYAACNGNKVKLRVKNSWIAPTVFWFIALGAPGTKKTHPIKAILKPLIDQDKNSKKNYDGLVREWESNEKKGEKPKFIQSVIQDYTIEALHLVHSINPKGICLYKDEIKGFLNDMNKYKSNGKGSDEQFWLESFNNSDYYVSRVSREPLLISNINIQVIGTIQHDVLEEVVADYSGNGLIDRFLFTRAETQVYAMSRKDIDPNSLQRFYDNVSAIINSPEMVYKDDRDTTILDIPTDCMEFYYDFDTQLTEIQNNLSETLQIRGYVSKLKSYYPRFVLLIALMDMFADGVEAEITMDVMERAKRVTMYFLSTARAVFSETEDNREMKSVIHSMNGKTKTEKIIALLKKGYKQTEIAKGLKTTQPFVSRVAKSNEL
jgi:hypothetical protein